MTTPYRSFSTRHTPQHEPIPSEQQVKNNAGGYVYETSPWEAFHRFLILGTEGGTYYVKERQLTKDAALNTMRCIDEDGVRAVKEIVTISKQGRAPKNDPAIFALSLAASCKNANTRALALAHLSNVCRIPTHLFQFAAYCKNLRGWGRGLRTAIGSWYSDKDPKQLAYHLAKYQQRHGWSNRDLLRLSHPKRVSSEHRALFQWTTQGDPTPPGILSALREVKDASRTRAAQLIQEFNLSWEMLPSEMLANKDVWVALLERMPMTAMIRNLGRLTHLGVIEPLSQTSKDIVQRLGDTDRLKKARVHPITVLNALRVYQKGSGDRGSLTWEPVGSVVDALNDTFYAVFDNVEPTHKNLMLALDVSGSMDWVTIAGTGLTPREASACLAMVTARVESNYIVMAFCTTLRSVTISPTMRLDTIIAALSNLPFGGTNCSLPMQEATRSKLAVDGFLIYTDNETWAGQTHPSQALRKYRQQSGTNAALVVNGMTTTEFSIADPHDPRSLNVVGFDTTTPQAISEFIRG